jgi:cobalamin biosynthesis Mg chelatase CobN
MVSWLKFVCVSVFLFSLVSVSVPWVSASNGDVVSLEVAEAEEALVSAYGVVLEAEEAGADVSGLLEKLNDGDEYLVEAYASVRLGDSENTSRFAGLCHEIAENVQSDAAELKDEAKDSWMSESVMVMLGSVVGVILVVGLCFVGWRVFKRRYHKRMRL